MKLGRTIAGGREIAESELARQKLLEKREKRKRVQLFLLSSVIIVIIIAGAILIQNAVKKVPTIDKHVETEKFTPSVEIVDEDGSNYVTERTKQYVGLMEKDAKDSNLKIKKVIIPSGKAREVDIYFEGRDEFYKCSLDRGTAESVEDVVRMINFLSKQGVKVSYIDVRLEGRAYYK